MLATHRQVLEDLPGQPLEGILALGVLDNTGAASFTIFFRALYIRLKDALLEIACDGDSGALILRRVEDPSPTWEISEDCQLATVDLSYVVFPHEHVDPLISVAEAYCDSSGQVVALGILLEPLQYLFFDPSFTSGVKVGGADLRAAWLSNRLKAASFDLVTVAR